jgi:hypothetical protein
LHNAAFEAQLEATSEQDPVAVLDVASAVASFITAVEVMVFAVVVTARQSDWIANPRRIQKLVDRIL